MNVIKDPVCKSETILKEFDKQFEFMKLDSPEGWKNIGKNWDYESEFPSKEKVGMISEEDRLSYLKDMKVGISEDNNGVILKYNEITTQDIEVAAATVILANNELADAQKVESLASFIYGDGEVLSENYVLETFEAALNANDGALLNSEANADNAIENSVIAITSGLGSNVIHEMNKNLERENEGLELARKDV